MSDAKSELSIFDKLSQESIIKLADFFNESIFITPPDKSEIKKIIGNDFKNEDIEKIISAFFNFIRSKLYPEKILEIVDDVELKEDKKILLKEIIQKIHDRVDSKDVTTGITSSFLHTFGFPHTHGSTTVTEFRPILESGKIIKFIPSLVVSIKTHNSDDGSDGVVNFQLGLDDAEEFVKTLNEGAESLKTEIQEIRNKFGDKIID